MRLIRYISGGTPEWGVQTQRGLIPFAGLNVEEPRLENFANPAYRRTLKGEIERTENQVMSADAVSILAPVPQPGKIVCVGMNYRDHAEEQGEEIPEKPLLFGKAPTAVTNPGDPIIKPADIEELDYEVELGVVIGRSARHVDAMESDEYIAGYTILNDISARDAQFADGQFFRGKSYDTFAPMGPVLRVGAEFDPNSVNVSLRVNGTVKQESSTEEFVFNVGELVEYISRVMTLRPGDVLSTGTPGGVGIFRNPPELLSDGDSVVAEIEGIGELQNPVISPST